MPRPIDYVVSRSTRLSVAGVVLGVIGALAVLSVPLWGGPALMRWAVEVICYLAAGADVEPDGWIRRHDVGRHPGLRRHRRLFRLRLRAAHGAAPLSRDPARRPGGGGRCGDDVAARVSHARRLFRDRHLGACGSVPHLLLERLAAWRRLRPKPHGDDPHRPQHAGDWRLSYRGVRPHRSVDRDQPSLALALRPRPDGAPRQRGRGREPGRRRQGPETPGLCARLVRRGPGRGDLFHQHPQDLPECGVRSELGGRGRLHRRHRRHRDARRTDRGDRHLLRAALGARRLRNLVLARHGRGRSRRRRLRSVWRLGLCPRSLGFAASAPAASPHPKGAVEEAAPERQFA